MVSDVNALSPCLKAGTPIGFPVLSLVEKAVSICVGWSSRITAASSATSLNLTDALL